MAAFFKGFEKQDEALLAVVDFPDAKKYTPYFNADGGISTRVQPFPHEERLDETAFKQKFAGLGFDAVKNLPFNEQGHDLTAMVLARIEQQGPTVPMPHLRMPGQFDA